MKELTTRQKAVLAYIQSYASHKGYTPSMRDVADFLGGVSTNAVEGYYKALESKGYIIRTPRVARSLRVVKQATP
jgi:repressor LexA